MQTPDFSDVPFFRKCKPKLAPQFLDSRIVASVARRYCYFRIPKAGNSSVMATLFRMEIGRAFGSAEEFRWFKRQYFERVSGMSESVVDELLNDYFMFTFLRSPYTRVLSAYLNKVQIADGGMVTPNAERRKVQKALGKGDADEISFDEFLTYLSDGGGLRKDPHWAPQVDLIPVGIDRLNFVGCVERMDTQLVEVMERTFGRKEEAVRYAPHSTDADGAAAGWMTPERRLRVDTLYQEDWLALKRAGFPE